MWSGGSRSVNFGQSEMGMVGLRDVFLVAPASSSYHNDVVMPDPHSAATIHGVGVIPLLTTAPCLDGDTSNMLNLGSHNNRSRGSGGIQLWQDHYLKKQGFPEHNGTTSSGNLAHTGGGGGEGLSGSALASGSTTCQDCGNQAKKDCSHRRCRTCCKSRGFDCSTHIKSTWVPAARRRERQLIASAAASGGGGGFSGATSVAKKPRLVASQTTTTSRTSTSNTTPRSFDTSSSHQDASFKESLPGQVRAPAVFKCVRVTAVDEGGDDEYAYQAVVKIGGHVFKGFLYDQGVEHGESYPNISELHLGGGGGGNGGGSGSGRNGATSSSPMVDPSDVYAAASGGAFLAGSTFGNAIN